MAVNETGTITLKIMATDLASGNIGKFIGNLDKMAKQGGLVGSMAQGVGQSIGQMVNPLSMASKVMDLGVTAASALFDGMQNLGRAFEEDRAAAAQFNNTVARSVPDWEKYKGVLDAAILSGQKMGYSDDAQRMSLAKLVTATRSATRSIELNRLAMNIARQRSISLEAATDAVTKAAQGQTRGLKGLGYQIDATATSTEQLDSVMRQAAGAADLYANSAGGKLAAKILELNERGEAAGESFVRLNSATNDLAMVVPEFGLAVAQNAGVLAKFFGLGEDAANDLKAATYDLPKVAMRYVDFNQTVNKLDFGGPVKSLRHAFAAMFSTMADQKSPWKEAWRDMARYAKDPFRPAAFENWLAKRAEKAAEKAAEAAAKGKPRVAAQWQALADVMSTPVLAALATTQAEIDALVAAMATVNLVTASTGGYRRNGSTGRHTKGHTKIITLPNGDKSTRWVPGRAMGGYAEAGRTYDVGENGQERLRMLPGGGAVVTPSAGGGGRGTMLVVNFNGLVTAPSEADADKVVDKIWTALERRRRRSGN